MALSKAYAGQGHLQHIAVHMSDGRIGVVFDPRGNTVPLTLADLSEAAQAGFVTFASDVAKKQGIGTLSQCETDFVKIITDAIAAKEEAIAK